jgi:hypothetical protein
LAVLPKERGVIQRGEFVDYAIAEEEYRPALVVRVWTDACVQLQVFADKVNDGADPLGFDWFRSSAVRGDVAGTWRPLPGTALRFAPMPPAPFAQPWMCNCNQTWIGTPKPACPVHGGSAPAKFAGFSTVELKPNAAGVYETAASATR